MAAAPAVATALALGHVTNNHRVTFASEDHVRLYKLPNSQHYTPPARSDSLDSQVKPARPEHKRRRSRQGSLDPLRELTQAFQKALPKSWGSLDELRNVARNFFAVAIGFNAGHRIKNYRLDRARTAMLAFELSKVIQTTNVILILDTQSSTLYVVHTQILSRRFEARPTEDDTIFLRIEDGVPTTLSQGQTGFLDDAFHYLERLLSVSSRQVLQVSDFGWSPIDTAYRMLTLGDWLLNLPVCYVAAGGLGSGAIDLRKYIDEDQAFWHMRVQADGVNPENDHTFDGCRVPMTLFSDDPELSSPRPDHSPPSLADRSRSLNIMQDRVQTKMFERLDACEAAMAIWSDVTCACEGPHPF